MVIKSLRNAYQLKWLRPHVIYSRQANLQERLLGDLKHKLLWGVVGADLGKCPCNCPNKFKVNGECAYGGNDSCQTSVTVYKCKHENCKYFYIGKSQRYIKTCVQEHIGEVTKLYAKNILTTNRSQKSSPPPQSSQTQSTTCSNPFSLEMQQTTSSPGSSKKTPPLCVVIDNQSDTSSINNPVVGEPPPILTFVPHPWQTKQYNCSALACHLYTHAQNLQFQIRAKVAAWYRSKIKIEILWQLNPINLKKQHVHDYINYALQIAWSLITISLVPTKGVR